MLLAAGCANELGEYFRKAQFRDPTSTLVSVRKVTGVTKRGEKLSVELSFGNVIAVDGDLSYVISLRDVSRKGELKQKLEAVRGELQEVRERRSALLDQYVTAASDFRDISYLVSHDLRAPVVNLIGFSAEVERLIAKVGAHASVQEATVASDDLRELLEVQMPEVLSFMRMSGEKAQRRFDAVVQLSRLGARPLRPKSVNLAQFVQGVIDAHVPPEFREDFSHTLGSAPSLHVDDRALCSILENVLDNALQAVHPGRQLRVQIGATWDDKNLTLMVQDNGIGMDPDDTARIFKLFQKTSSSPASSLGCGLASCHRLASRLGGKIWCDARSGEGAVFSIRLPFLPAQDATPAVAENSANTIAP